MKHIYRWSGAALAVAATLSSPASTVSLAATTAPAIRLVDAIKQQNTALVQSLLKQGADVNVADADGMTPLMWAAHWDDLATVQQLLRAGARVHAATRYGVTALAEAAGVGDARMIQVFLQAGGDPNAALLDGGETPLMRAARAGTVDGVRFLLDGGAAVNTVESERGETALMYASAENHADVAKMLVARGADVNARSTAWDNKHQPVWGGSIAYMYNNGGLTALLLAARENAIDTGRVLIAAGADLNVADPDFKLTPILLAIENGHFDFGRLLVESGANLDDGAVYMLEEIRNLNRTSKRPVPRTRGSLELMQAMLDWGADPNAPLTHSTIPRENGNPGPPTIATPLLRAARAMDLDAMRVLLDGGADPNMGTEDRSTPLMGVLGGAAGGRGGGMGFGGPAASPDDGKTLAAMKLLVDYGADVNAVNNAGDTALHTAAQRGRDVAVQFLADHRATLDIRNKQGRTPLDFANGVGVGAGGRGRADGAVPPAAPPQRFASTAALLDKLMNGAIGR